MSAADEFAVIQRFTCKIAAALDLPDLPPCLNREQIAKIVETNKGGALKNAHTLATTVNRGVAKRQTRWLVFQSMIGRGAHAVPTRQVAHWLAVDNNALPVPEQPEAEPAWPGPRRRHRCEG
jgi:hypothetical protein